MRGVVLPKKEKNVSLRVDMSGTYCFSLLLSLAEAIHTIRSRSIDLNLLTYWPLKI